jgi:LysM repeat protein
MWEPTGPVQQAITVEATGYCGTVQFINKQIWPYGSDEPAPGGSNGGTTPANPTPSCSVTYTVRSGDSLYSISQTYGVTVDALRAANNISGNLIFPGNTLCIP